ncbi:serine hydrolase [Panacibacter ginsenosidivorans]|uniref:Serine hydrolase n=1 Tax=Panacibacter ginsenosidivorans TaxID=1813871 RepID=A0A5B8VGF8_9BACT|nr:serine hydrolase [Panacibacter ginsenosidivorans]QEC69388.1 serine hydrolase [Panacibacter ginsenosidivorans]
MFLKRLTAVILVCFVNHIISFAQQKTGNLLATLLQKDTSAAVRKVISDPLTYRLQIIYTQIDRDKYNNPSFKNYYFNVDGNTYFNPASTVKLPLALLSLEKLNSIHINGVDKYATLLTDSTYSKQTTAYTDSTSKNYLPSLAHYIKKAFLISDNDAYNRMYEFVGQQTINRQLHNKGYTDIRITRRFTGMNEDENRHTNAIRFVDENNKLLYTQPAAYNTDSFDFSHIVKMGNAYYDRNDSLIHKPIDFTKANNLPLESLQQLLQSALFPASVPKQQRFNLSKDDYDFLYQYLSQYPSETNYPKYDTAHYYDSYVKFYFQNEGHQMPKDVRVFNKVGWAYGFMTDVSYVVDFSSKTEFMLTATIYVNSDGILNDNKYDYDSIGVPFMYRLGQLVYNYDKQRSREFKPDLKKFMINYEKRDPTDIRPLIKDADN